MIPCLIDDLVPSRQDRETMWRMIFEQCFGRKPDEQAPPYVGVTREDNGLTSGFMAGYWRDTTQFHIKWTGVMPAFRGANTNNIVFALLRTGMDFFGAHFYSTSTVSTELVTQKVLTKMKFQVNGFHTDTNGIAYVDWIKRWRRSNG